MPSSSVPPVTVAHHESVGAVRSGAAGQYVRVWDLPLRIFHWLLVATILIAFLSAEEGSPLTQWHVTSGWVAGVLIVFRLVWGAIGGENARFMNFVKPAKVWSHVRETLARRGELSLGHNPLGGLSTVILIALIATVVLTGVALIQGTSGEDLHEMLANVLLLLIGLHVAAVLVVSLLTRENLIGAMVTGSKRAALHPGAAEARRPPSYALPVAALIAAVAAYGATRLDPLAFTPHHPEEVEEGEHRGAEGQLLGPKEYVADEDV